MVPVTPSKPGGRLQIQYSSIAAVVIISALLTGGFAVGKKVYDDWTAIPVISLPEMVRGRVGEIIAIKAGGSAKDVRWHTDDKALHIAPIVFDDTIFVTSATPGTYTISAHGALHNQSTEITSAKIIISADGPNPPGPGPDPTPGPGPNPPPEPAPIPGDGLKVLIVYDKDKEKSLPEDQKAILYGSDVRKYLDDKCVKEPDGTTPSWRVWYSTVNADNEIKQWRDALARAKGHPLPWIIISNGKTGFEGPLPANVAGTMTLLKTYGG